MSKIEFVNLTPHEIRIYPYYAADKGRLRDGVEPLRTFPPADKPARAQQREVLLSTDGDIPIVAMEFGDVENLPPPVEGRLYICSAVAAERAALAGRRDVVMVAGSIRDRRGCVVGAVKFARPSV